MYRKIKVNCVVYDDVTVCTAHRVDPHSILGAQGAAAQAALTPRNGTGVGAPMDRLNPQRVGASGVTTHSNIVGTSHAPGTSQNATPGVAVSLQPSGHGGALGVAPNHTVLGPPPVNATRMAYDGIQNAQRGRSRHDQVRQWLNDHPHVQDAPVRRQLLDNADLMLDVAHGEYERGDFASGDATLDGALKMLDLVVDFVPGASLVKDAVSLLTGINPITGDTLTNVEKGFLIAGMLFPALAKGSLRILGKLTQRLTALVARQVRSSPQAKVALEAIRHAAAVDAKYGEHVVAALRRADVQAAAARWGTSTGGFNQLVMHTVGKALDSHRLPSLEKRAGLAAGSLSDFVNAPSAESVSRSMLEIDRLAQRVMQSPHQAALESGRKWWLAGHADTKAGLQVVERFGKIQSVMPKKFDPSKGLPL